MIFYLYDISRETSLDNSFWKVSIRSLNIGRLIRSSFQQSIIILYLQSYNIYIVRIYTVIVYRIN